MESSAAPVDQSQNPSASKPGFNITHVAIIALLLAGGAGFLLSRSNLLVPATQPTPNTQPETGDQATESRLVPQPQVGKITFQPLENSSERVFGLSFQGKLYVVSVDREKLGSTQLEDGSNTSVRTVVLGESAITTSPDGKYVAYQTADQQLALITGDRHQKILLPKQLKVSWVGPWSPDSKRLIVRSTPLTITPHFEQENAMQLEVPPTIRFEKGLLPGGYYLVDVKAGEVTPLTPVVGFSGWIDNSKIMVSQNESQFDAQTLHVFNLDTYTVETRNLFEDEEKFFSVQRSVSHDGKRWALTLWPSGQDVEALTTIVADFPNLQGEVIAQGIKTQSPVISPDGSTVLVHTQDEQNGPQFVEYWRDGQMNRVGKGVPLQWINNTQFVFAEMSEELSTNPNNHLQKLYLHDLESGQSWELFSI